MTQRSGTANLPLHGGRVPAWLAVRMAALGRVIVEAIVHEYGRQEVLRRIADPFWFQSFGAVMGMDWHSSGITTSVIGALKRGLAPVQRELGLYVCGGRGAQSRKTPAELTGMGESTGLDTTPMVRCSRLVAKIDSAAVQDGYDLYLHGFFAAIDGAWCVVQQGMNTHQKEARRYHWKSERIDDFFESPHAAIEGRNVGSIVNLADAHAARNREASLSLVGSGPDALIAQLKRCNPRRSQNLELFDVNPPETLARPAMCSSRHLHMPPHHAVHAADIDLKRLHATLASAAERGPTDFAELLLSPGVGARTVAAVAYVAEVIHGAPCRFQDPARFALAHGGKDGHPFPVPIKVYDETLSLLKRAVIRANLGNRETLDAIKRLDDQARRLEGLARGPTLAEHIAAERRAAPALGGRAVN